MRKLKAGLVLASTLFMSYSYSQDIANCMKSDDQVQFLAKKQSATTRIEAMRVLIQDLKTLKVNMLQNKDELPKSLLSRCYNKKIEAVEAIAKLADQQLLGNTDFLMFLGEYAMIRGRFETAYSNFKLVAQRFPFTYVPHWKTLEAWTHWRKYSNDTMELREINRTTAQLLNNLLNTKDVPNYIRVHAENLNVGIKGALNNI